MMLSSCAIFKKKCDCPKVGQRNTNQTEFTNVTQRDKIYN